MTPGRMVRRFVYDGAIGNSLAASIQAVSFERAGQSAPPARWMKLIERSETKYALTFSLMLGVPA